MPSLVEWVKDNAKKPEISVLLATYNGEKFIRESVMSVLNQTFENFELLVGFNGTTDSSKIIVSEFDDDRIKIFDYKEDKGKGKTLNKLLKESKKEWIAIQDDDDLWYPEKLKSQVAFCQDYDVIGSQILYMDENGKSPTIHGLGPKLQATDESIKELTKGGENQIANSSSIIKKECAESVGGWAEDIDGIEDLDFWLKVINKNYKFVNLSNILVSHRVYAKSNFNVFA